MERQRRTVHSLENVTRAGRFTKTGLARRSTSMSSFATRATRVSGRDRVLQEPNHARGGRQYRGHPGKDHRPPGTSSSIKIPFFLFVVAERSSFNRLFAR